jgi:hypothetical protein
MHEYINKTVLLTSQSWFYAPDGKQYKSVWGTLKGIHEAGKTLGFIPNRSHANWFIEIGNMTIMGCQVLFVVLCDKPEMGPVTDWTYEKEGGKAIEYERPTAIYIADKN